MPIRRVGERTDSPVHRANTQEEPGGTEVDFGRARFVSSFVPLLDRRSTGELEVRKPQAPDLYQALPEEEEAVKVYALEHPRDGYRPACWPQNSGSVNPDLWDEQDSVAGAAG